MWSCETFLPFNILDGQKGTQAEKWGGKKEQQKWAQKEDSHNCIQQSRIEMSLTACWQI